MKVTSKFNSVLFAMFIIFALTGCASLKEKARGFAGISTKDLGEQRVNAIKEQISLDYFSCYNKVKELLQAKGAYVYTEDPANKMLAIYLSETDTTTAGVFFNEISSGVTQIEISSGSTYAKEVVYKMLEGLPKPEEKKGSSDAK